MVDEGSSDGTAGFLAGIGDARVRVVRHDVPRGVPGARNAGVALAEGEWVGFLDDDDLWAPEKLRSQLDAVSAGPGCDWACVSAVHVDPELRVVGGMRIADGRGILERLLVHNAIPGGGSGVIVRKRLLEEAGGFREDLKAGEDWECWIRLAELSRLAVVDRPLLAYRMDVHSMSYDIERQQREEAKVRALHPDLTHRADERGAQASRLYLARQEMRSGGRLRPARRFLAAAISARTPRYLVRAGGALLSPRLTSVLGIWRWRRSLEKEWVGLAENWLAIYRRGGGGT